MSARNDGCGPFDGTTYRPLIRCCSQTLVTTLKAGQTLLVAWDPLVTPMDTFYVFRREQTPFLLSSPAPYWNIPILFAEALE